MDNDQKRELERLVDKTIDSRLNSNDKQRLAAILSNSTQAVEHYHELLDNYTALCCIYPGELYASTDDSHRDRAKPIVLTNLAVWALAVSLVVLSCVLFSISRMSPTAIPADNPRSAAAATDEQLVSGHATLRRAAGIQWPHEAKSFRVGDVLPAGTVQFREGVAEIDFFCGANLVVEGPANLEVESDWSVRINEGRMRVNVPPAARGFIVKAADAEIVDLGTEFSLDVDRSNAKVRVEDGEVKLRGGSHDGVHLLTGESRQLQGTDFANSLPSVRTTDEIRTMHANEQHSTFAAWKKYSEELRNDDRLIAYYPISSGQQGSIILNAAPSGPARDGTLIGLVNRTFGRFGESSTGLEFDRVGSRVRVRIDDEFEAFTFSCWAKVDSLDRTYNALFMSDGYENGELHWQLANDGRLMFSVMVDDTPGAGNGKLPDSRLHRIYYTQPVWDISKSGEWFHAAAVYDPAAKRVTQYVNGELVGDEEIIPEFFVETLRIGPAEIGNWGQPFRKSPGFAIRNLNGAIDEMAIFDEALSENEIVELFENGKPLGY